MLGRVALVLALLVAGLGIWLAVRPAAPPAVVTEESHAPTPPPASVPVPATGSPNLRGRLVFEGAAPSGLRVEIVPDGQERSPETPGVEVNLSTEHVFEIPSLPGDVVHVRAMWEGGQALFGPWSLHPDEGEPRPLVDDWRIGSGSVSGRILDPAGRAVAGAGVMDVIGDDDRPLVVADRYTWTDASGTWRFDFLPAGRHEITVYHPRSKASPSHKRTDSAVLKVGEHRTVNLGWEAGDVVWEGRLRSARGTVPPWVELRLSDPKTSRRVSQVCDPEGRFLVAFRPGVYDLRVSSYSLFPHEIQLSEKLRCSEPAPSSTTCVRLDSNSHGAITLIGGDISGHVSTPSRALMSRARVELEGRAVDDSWGLVSFWSRVDEGGRFSFIALRPGRYQVSGLVMDGVRGAATERASLVGPDGQPVVVDVVDGGEITGLELRLKAP